MYQNTHLYNEYIFECDYYDDFCDKEYHVCALVMAPTMHEAVEAIEQRLPYCTNLHISPFDEQQFVWMSQADYNRMIDPKNEYMFEQENEVEIVRCGPEVSKPDFKISDWADIEVTCDEDKAWEELFMSAKDMPEGDEDDDTEYWAWDRPSPKDFKEW